MSISKTKEQLILENDELRSRLTEAEEALNAIQTGEVDAIVVSGKEGEQIYSISSAETPYRTFLEEMNEGAVTITKKGIILYCNRRFSEFVQEPAERVIGSILNRFIVPDDKSKFDNLLAQQPDDKNNVIIVSLINSLHLKLSFSLLPSYLNGGNCVLIATDISELKKNENELRELLGSLVNHIQALRALRIDNISANFDVEVQKNRLEIANNKLDKEMAKLKRIVVKLKQELNQKKASI